MQQKIALLHPAFTPEDATLAPASFETFLELVKTKNNLVAAAEAAESQSVTLHKNLYDRIKTHTLRVVDTVEGNEAWAAYLPKIKEHASMVRNSRPAKPAPPATPGAPAKPRRKRGQQSYGDIDRWFEKLIEAVKLVPGYMPAVTSNIQITQLETLLFDYREANKDAAAKGAAASKERSERLPLYNGKTGSLRAKMKAIKKAVGGQYGRESTQFAEVKSIAL
jgi:hypothetical protein